MELWFAFGLLCAEIVLWSLRWLWLGNDPPVEKSNSTPPPHEAQETKESPSVPVSKFAENLIQLESNRIVPTDPKKWKCRATGQRENLWLNLSTGFIGAGGPKFDGGEGIGSMFRHFIAGGRKYPLAVKLESIGPTGALVYSYASEERGFVSDPFLEKHLAHFGITLEKPAIGQLSLP
ncbi:hypothetical protein BSKO_02252 [Bryopsis sp. KO-2023]|nr:hypothetical protein BSKO_02252 [Bryopsis sp. KO-2023]